MANRKKKTSPGELEEKKDDKNWWKAPAIFVGILTLFGTIIATLPDILRAVNETKNIPTDAPVALMASPAYQPGPCDGYFSSDAIIVQSGIPKNINAKGEEVVEIKLMDNDALVGGVKFLPDTRYLFTSDQQCAQVKPAFSIEFETKNTIEFGEFVLQITYRESSQSLELELAKQ